MSPPVVMVRMLYGLGNQMFQYAAARRLAHVTGAELVLDLSCYDHWNIHPYRLDRFNIGGRIASREEAAPFNSIAIASRVGKLLFRVKQELFLRRTWNILYENEVGVVDQRVLNAKGDTYLGGYWQSEKYFVGIADTVRREFTLRAAPGPRNAEMADRMRNTRSVSLHVRRGGNAKDPDSVRTVGTCSTDYYRVACCRIGEQFSDAEFFVFSDEPEWARANLRLDRPATFVEHNGVDRDYEELWLMSRCRHHIIANSTFSWWAAWLNPDADKVVLAPQKWLADEMIDARDVVPSSWIRV